MCDEVYSITHIVFQRDEYCDCSNVCVSIATMSSSSVASPEQITRMTNDVNCEPKNKLNRTKRLASHFGHVSMQQLSVLKAAIIHRQTQRVQNE